MASKTQHQFQALKNETFFNEFDLNSTAYLDWAVVAIFYAALHHVESYLVTTSVGNANGHGDRRNKIRNDPQIASLSKPYQELRRRCDDARYYLVPFQPQAVLDLFQDEFQKIKTQITSLI